MLFALGGVLRPFFDRVFQTDSGDVCVVAIMFVFMADVSVAAF